MCGCSFFLTHLFSLQSCIRALWHARLNQILVGLSDGTLHIYYDPETSHAGALSCVTRPIRRARQQEVMREQMILSRTSLHTLSFIITFSSCSEIQVVV